MPAILCTLSTPRGLPGSPGLGTTWHGVIGINSGGRVHLNSHDAARFKIIVPPGSTPFSAACPGCEPFAADDLILQAAPWAGGGSQTGLMIFNDSARFGTVGGSGWNNAELNLSRNRFWDWASRLWVTASPAASDSREGLPELGTVGRRVVTVRSPLVFAASLEIRTAMQPLWS